MEVMMMIMMVVMMMAMMMIVMMKDRSNLWFHLLQTTHKHHPKIAR
jgi:hypothetical protein